MPLCALTSSIKVYFERVLNTQLCKYVWRANGPIRMRTTTDRPQLILNHFFVGFLCASTNIVKMGKMCETQQQQQKKKPQPKRRFDFVQQQRKRVEKRKIISAKIEMGWCENDDVVVHVLFVSVKMVKKRKKNKIWWMKCVSDLPTLSPTK